MNPVIVIERLAAGLIWISLLIGFSKPAWRTLKTRADLKSHEPVMAATWILAGNRLTFTVVGQFLPDSDFATMICYVGAIIGGCAMLFCGSWARRVGG